MSCRTGSTFRLDRRMVPEENPAEVEAELRAVIARAAALHPDAKVAVRRILLAEPLTPTPAGAKLTEALCRHASRVMGEPVAASGVPLYTDARHYAKAGRSDRALRRRPAYDRGGQRPPRRRAPAARGPLQGDGGDRADAGGADGGEA